MKTVTLFVNTLFPNMTQPLSAKHFFFKTRSTFLFEKSTQSAMFLGNIQGDLQEQVRFSHLCQHATTTWLHHIMITISAAITRSCGYFSFTCMQTVIRLDLKHSREYAFKNVFPIYFPIDFLVFQAVLCHKLHWKPKFKLCRISPPQCLFFHNLVV